MKFNKENYIDTFDIQFNQICTQFTSSIQIPDNSCLLVSLDFLPSNGILYHLEANVKQALGIDQWPYFDLYPLKEYLSTTNYTNIVLLTTSTFYNGYTSNKIDSFSNILSNEFSNTNKVFSIEVFEDMELDIEYFENRSDTFFIFHRIPPTDFWKSITDKIVYQNKFESITNMPSRNIDSDIFIKMNKCNSSAGVALLNNLESDNDSIDTSRYVVQRRIDTDTFFGRRTDIVSQAAIMNDRYFNITKDKFYNYHYESFDVSTEVFNMFSSYGSIVEGTLVKLSNEEYKLIEDITDNDEVEFWYSPDIYSFKINIPYLKEKWYSEKVFDDELPTRLLKESKKVIGKFETMVLSYTQISENVHIARGNKSILNYDDNQWKFTLTENLKNSVSVMNSDLELIDISELNVILSLKKCYKIVLDGHNLNCGFFNLNGKLILTD